MIGTKNLDINLIAENQASKAVTVNEALTRIDSILNTGAISQILATPPISPAQGDMYVVAASATGDWVGRDLEIAYYEQIWKFITPNEGMTLWVSNEDKLYSWNGTSWILSSLASGVGSLTDLSDVAITTAANYDILQHDGTNFVNNSSMNNVAGIGVNTTSDVTNKLAVRSDAVLFDTDTGSNQIKLNKNLATDTASYLFQTGYSGRAEFGTIGNDDFELKVSSDGSIFNQSFVVENANGNVDFKQNVNFTGAITGLDINGLDDVNAPSPADGEVMTYDSTSSNWQAQASAGGVDFSIYDIGNGTYHYGKSIAPDGFNTDIPSANIIRFMSFIVPRTTTFNRIGVNITSASASGSLRLGIYNGDGIVPTSLTLDAGSVSTATTGVKEIVISQELEAGIYYLAALGDESFTCRAISSSYNDAMFGSPLSALLSVSHRGITYTYGALPASAGITSANWLSGSAIAVFLRKV